MKRKALDRFVAESRGRPLVSTVGASPSDSSSTARSFSTRQPSTSPPPRHYRSITPPRTRQGGLLICSATPSVAKPTYLPEPRARVARFFSWAPFRLSPELLHLIPAYQEEGATSVLSSDPQDLENGVFRLRNLLRTCLKAILASVPESDAECFSVSYDRVLPYIRTNKGDRVNAPANKSRRPQSSGWCAVRRNRP
jgi:hypothetical protein